MAHSHFIQKFTYSYNLHKKLQKAKAYPYTIIYRGILLRYNNYLGGMKLIITAEVCRVTILLCVLAGQALLFLARKSNQNAL